MQPLMLCTYDVDAESVFNALSEECCRSLGMSKHDLACSIWEADMLAGVVPASQALADRLMVAGYAGMLVRSFAAGAGSDDRNLVVWKWGQDQLARIDLIDDEGRLSGVSTC